MLQNYYNRKNLHSRRKLYEIWCNSQKVDFYLKYMSKSINQKSIMFGLCDLFFCSALHSSPKAVLPSHESKKGLADWCVTFFSDKIAKIRYSFSSSDSFTLPPPPDVPNFR